MPITVRGTLRDPLDQIASHAKLRFTTIHGGGDTLNSAVTVYQADGLGNYDFILVNGIHKIEVKFYEQWFDLGDVSIAGQLTDVMTIAQLLNLTTPPDDPTLAEMRDILAQVNAAASGLDDLVTQASEHATTAQNAATSASNSAVLSSQSRDEAAVFTDEAEEFAIRAEIAAENAESGSGGGGVNISITGQSYALRGQTVTWEITDFDEFSPYEVTVPVGVHGAISGRFFSIRVDPEFTGDNLGFSLKRDSFNRQFTVRVLDRAIEKPSIVYPAMGTNDVAIRPVITSSTFESVPTNIVHTQTQWQVSLFPDFSVNVIDTGDTLASNNLKVDMWESNGLFSDSTYYSRVKYVGTHNGQRVESEWSDAAQFTTVTVGDFVWSKAATYPVNVIDSSIRSTAMIGSFLCVYSVASDGHRLTNYDVSGDVVSSMHVADTLGIFDREKSSLKMKVMHSRDTVGRPNSVFITIFGSASPTAISSQFTATFEVSTDSGQILIGNESFVNASVGAKVDPMPMYQFIQTYNAANTPVALFPNLSGTVFKSNLRLSNIGTNSSSLPSAMRYAQWDCYESTRMSDTTSTSAPYSWFKINLQTGLLTKHFDHAPSATTVHATSPSLSNLMDRDITMLTNITDRIRDPENTEPVILFSPHKNSILHSPRIFRSSTLVTGADIAVLDLVTAGNIPDVDNPAYTSKAAVALCTVEKPEFARLQLILKTDTSVEVWQLDVSSLMVG